MKFSYIYSLLLFFTFNLSYAQDKNKEGDLKYVTDQVEVKGQIKNPMTLTLESLKKMKVIEGKNLKIVGHGGVVKKNVESYKAVLLKDIIDSSQVVMKEKKDRGKFIVLVSASDGYQVLFTYNELFYSSAGENIFVCFEEEGKPINAEGKFIVFCSSDIVSGPRHIKWVKTIEVKEL